MTWPEPILAVTGASGFVGAAIVRSAVRRGLRMRVLLRPGSALPGRGPLTTGIEVVRGDLAEDGDVRRLVDGAAAVIHLAAAMNSVDGATMHRVNVDGTVRVAGEVSRAGVGRLVFMSSVAATRPWFGPYARSKAEAEQALRRSLPSAVILRPPVVVGPGSPAGRALIRLAGLPVVPVPAGRGVLRPIHVDDLAEAAIEAAIRVGISGRLYELPGDRRLHFSGLARSLLRDEGLDRPVLGLPVAAWSAAVAALRGLGVTPPLTAESLRSLAADTPGDATRAKEELGFSPRDWGGG